MSHQSKNRYYYNTLIFGMLILSQSLESASPQTTLPSWKQWLYGWWNNQSNVTSTQKATSPNWTKYALVGGGLLFVTFVAGSWLKHKADEQRRKKIVAEHAREIQERGKKWEQERTAREAKEQHDKNLKYLSGFDVNLAQLYAYLLTLDKPEYTTLLKILKNNKLNILWTEEDKIDPLTLACELLWSTESKEKLQEAVDKGLVRSEIMIGLVERVPTKQYFTSAEIKQLAYAMSFSYSNEDTSHDKKQIIKTLANSISLSGLELIQPENTYITLRLSEISRVKEKVVPPTYFNNSFAYLCEMQPIATIRSQLSSIRDGKARAWNSMFMRQQEVDPTVKKLCDQLLNKIDEIVKTRTAIDDD